ncbi:hypothetical protein UlMin_031280 [Ulmus minor]
MLGFCCKTLSLPFQSSRNVGNSVSHLFFLQTAPVFPKSFSSQSSIASEEEKERSFMVSYLSNSCGLSPETALFVSKRVKIKTLEKPDAVLRFFREYGFTETHISKLVRCGPNLLLANVDKRIFPKFEFFHSIGISGSDLVRVITRNPSLLSYSLEKTIVPFYDVISQFLPVRKVVKIFGQSNWQFSAKLPINCGPNILALREVGVPNTFISYLLVSCRGASIVTRNTDKFKEIVAKVISMGFDPCLLTFTTALEMISLTSKSKWEGNMELYRKCGWTEDEILLAFRKFPYIMSFAKNNVMIKMDFFVNKMGWQPADVARTPVVLSFNLENRIKPRCSVIRVLLLKGLLKKKLSLSTILIDTKFLDRYVLKYQQEVPQLSKIFQGKMSLAELGLGFEDRREKNCSLKE